MTHQDTLTNITDWDSLAAWIDSEFANVSFAHGWGSNGRDIRIDRDDFMLVTDDGELLVGFYDEQSYEDGEHLAMFAFGENEAHAVARLLAAVPTDGSDWRSNVRALATGEFANWLVEDEK